MAAAAEHSYIHPPESEIYGRSLSAVRRLGAFAIGKTELETIHSPEANQARAEFYTSVEEGFGTDMELGGGLEVRDFDERPVINGHVMAADLKTPISAMTHAGLKRAFKKVNVENDHHFIPQLTRSKWDHENALIVDQMAACETDYNTRIVISPFPEEGAARSGNAYWSDIGYVPHLKRGFVQLYHVGEGSITAGSLSFDGTDKGRLRKIFASFGIEIPEDEITDNWLKYAITGNFSTEEAKALATKIADTAGDPGYKKNTNTVDVTKQYEFLMARVFNESYIHVCESLARGCQTNKARELIHHFTDKARYFNDRYAEALYRMEASPDHFMDDDSIVLHELLVYSTIEMMRALHLQGEEAHQRREGDVRLMPTAMYATDSTLFQNMLGNFGANGAMNNRTYSACGLSISLGGEKSESNPQKAFGGEGGSEEKSETDNNSGNIRCIKCRKVVPKKEVIKKDCWECPACKHKVDICSGKVLREGKVKNNEPMLAEVISMEEHKRTRQTGKVAIESSKTAA